MLLRAAIFAVLPAALVQALGNESCAEGQAKSSLEEFPQAADTGFQESLPLQLIWPPSRETFPNLALITLCVWLVVGNAMMSKESDAEKEHQRRRARQIFSELAQTQHEDAESCKRWAAYNGRKDTLMKMACERLAQLQQEQPKTRDRCRNRFCLGRSAGSRVGPQADL